MRRHATSMYAAAAAIAVLAALTTTATAGRLSTSNNLFRGIWAPVTFGSESIIIRCNLTVEGSFHYRSFVKQARALIGYVTKAAISHPCSGGEAWPLNGVEVVLGGTVPNTLPWHMSYEAFEGTLPSITGIRYLVSHSFMGEAAGVLCLFGGNIQGVIKLTRGVATEIIPDPAVTNSKVSGGILCPAGGRFSLEAGSENRVTVLGSTTQITITLI